MVKPGGSIQLHWHANSIISGAFYPTVEKTDKICFHDPNNRRTQWMVSIEPNEDNPFNTQAWGISVENNMLVLFPSWLVHSVEPNEKATTDRISISFNTFVKGTLGIPRSFNELILK